MSATSAVATSPASTSTFPAAHDDVGQPQGLPSFLRERLRLCDVAACDIHAPSHSFELCDDVQHSELGTAPARSVSNILREVQGSLDVRLPPLDECQLQAQASRLLGDVTRLVCIARCLLCLLYRAFRVAVPVLDVRGEHECAGEPGCVSSLFEDRDRGIDGRAKISVTRAGIRMYAIPAQVDRGIGPRAAIPNGLGRANRIFEDDAALLPFTAVEQRSPELW